MIWMIRLAAITALAFCSITAATAAQDATQNQSDEAGDDNTCMFAGGEYSEGAEFCVTSHAALKCEGGKWSRDAQLDCTAGMSEMPKSGSRPMMTPDQMGPDQMGPDHMAPHQ
jgi:hypothetical protein